MTSALRRAVMRAILMFHNYEGQSHKTVSTVDHNFWRERRAEADSNRGSSAYQPNALPLGQTSLLHCVGWPLRSHIGTVLVCDYWYVLGCFTYRFVNNMWNGGLCCKWQGLLWNLHQGLCTRIQHLTDMSDHKYCLLLVEFNCAGYWCPVIEHVHAVQMTLTETAAQVQQFMISCFTVTQIWWIF